MANPKHLKILQQGSETFNKWRKEKENLDIKPDLIGANLSRTDLSKIDLRGADLRGASFKETNLSGADLSGADLSEIDLNEAWFHLSGSRSGKPVISAQGFDLSLAEAISLKGGSLYEANLSGANLSSANFRGAHLWRANLNEANLSRADLNYSSFWQAKLLGANLEEAVCEGANFEETNLSGANLSNAWLKEAHLKRADLRKADLRKTILRGADISETNLSEADLRGAYLEEAKLSGTDLRNADISSAYLDNARLIGTKLNHANLTGCSIFGISAWGLDLEGANQTDLIITAPREPAITIDNLEIAQFVYLLLHNEKIRNVIETIGRKGVLILGRFTAERKAVLYAIRKKLRELGFVPMLFDFEKPTQRDFTETIKTLAGLSRFIIADITNPRSSPLELQAIIPDYMIPFVPIIQEDEKPFAMFQDLQQKYGDWVLQVLKYDTADNLLDVLEKAVVKPALEKGDQLLLKKAKGIRDRHVKDYLK
jgi:uncharacterized protein YjbI with pentapeptide repeats